MMKKNLFRFLSILAILVLMSCFFVACDDDKETPSDSNPSQTVENTESSQSSESSESSESSQSSESSKDETSETKGSETEESSEPPEEEEPTLEEILAQASQNGSIAFSVKNAEALFGIPDTAIKFFFREHSKIAQISTSVEEKQIDFSAFINKDDIIFTSESIFGEKALGVNMDDLTSRYNASIFADETSPYYMGSAEELGLESIIEAYSHLFATPSSEEDLTPSFGNYLKKLGELFLQHANPTIQELEDKVVKSFTFTNETFVAVFNDFLLAIENDAAFFAILEELFTILDMPFPDDIHAHLDTLSEQITVFFTQQIPPSSIAVELTFVDEVLVSFYAVGEEQEQTIFEIDLTVEDSGICFLLTAQAQTLTLDCNVKENSDTSFEAEVKLSISATQTTLELLNITLSYDKTSGAYVLTLVIFDASTEIPRTNTIAIAGKLHIEKNSIAFLINSIKFNAAIIKDFEVFFTINAEEALPKNPEYKDILDYTIADVEELENALSTFFPVPEGSTPDTAFTVNPGEINGIFPSDFDVVYYTITPTETAEYCIESFGEFDLFLDLYRGDELLVDSDDDGDNLNFKLTYELIAGETYILAIGSYDEAVIENFIFSITKKESDFVTDETDKKWDNVSFDGETLKIAVSVNQNEEVTYEPGDKYIKGPDTLVADTVLAMVYNRNQKVATRLDLNIEYTETDLWYDKVAANITNYVNQDASDSPDIYNNDIYGLTLAMLDGKGSLHNLKSSKPSYFDFEHESWYTEFMTGLTLNEDKMYILAGDMFLDILRMAWVVYVNIDIFNEKCYDEFGEIDLLYELIEFTNEHESWNYDYMIQFMDNAWTDTGSVHGKADIDDEIVGMALSGVHARRVFTFTSGLSIAEEVGGKYQIIEDNTPMHNLAKGYVDLTSENAVCYVWPLVAMTKFFDGEALFATGVLGEYESDMARNVDFSKGVVPFPKYSNEQDDYHTLIHDQAEVAGILRNTGKFTEASAYLQYMNEQSTAILIEYFETSLKIKYNDDRNTKLMLDIIRDKIDSPLDSCLLVTLSNYNGAVLPIYELVVQGNGFTAAYAKQFHPMERALETLQEKFDDELN